MIEISKFEGNHQVVWDASSLETFITCPTKYKYGYIDNLRSLRGRNAASYWGTAFHDGIEAYDTALFYEVSRGDAVDFAVHTVVERYGHTLQGADNTSRNLDTLIRAVVWYDAHYADDKYETIASPDGTPALEEKFTVPLWDGKHRLSGRIDALKSFENTLYVFDHKTTTTTIGEYYFKDFRPSFQFICYIWAVRQFVEQPVRGVIINACQTAAGFARFGRSIYQVNEAELLEFEKEMTTYMEMADDMADASYWPRNPSSCGKYGGCDFRNVCSQSPEFRPTWLAEDFTTRS